MDTPLTYQCLGTGPCHGPLVELSCGHLFCRLCLERRIKDTCEKCGELSVRDGVAMDVDSKELVLVRRPVDLDSDALSDVSEQTETLYAPCRACSYQHRTSSTWQQDLRRPWFFCAQCEEVCCVSCAGFTYGFTPPILVDTGSVHDPDECMSDVDHQAVAVCLICFFNPLRTVEYFKLQVNNVQSLRPIIERVCDAHEHSLVTQGLLSRMLAIIDYVTRPESDVASKKDRAFVRNAVLYDIVRNYKNGRVTLNSMYGAYLLYQTRSAKRAMDMHGQFGTGKVCARDMSAKAAVMFRMYMEVGARESLRLAISAIYQIDNIDRHAFAVAIRKLYWTMTGPMRTTWDDFEASIPAVDNDNECDAELAKVIMAAPTSPFDNAFM